MISSNACIWVYKDNWVFLTCSILNNYRAVHISSHFITFHLIYLDGKHAIQIKWMKFIRLGRKTFSGENIHMYWMPSAFLTFIGDIMSKVDNMTTNEIL